MPPKASSVALFILMGLTLGRSQQDIHPASERVALSKAVHGVDGWLRVVSDARLTAEMKRKLWGVGWEYGLEDGNPLKKTLSAKPPDYAKLEIVDSQQRVIERDQLERPLATIDRTHLRSRDTFLVTVDYSIGFGSYAGPTASLVDVHDGKIIWLKAIDADNHKEEPIRFSKTLKSDWKFVPFAGNRDILTVHWHPDFASTFKRRDEFVVEYTRYRFKNGKWIKYKHEQKGYWESDQPFPPMNQFRDK